MKARYRIPHVEKIEIPRPHVLRVTFDDGLTKELEFVKGDNKDTVFEELEDPKFFEKVRVDPESHTVVWPNGLDLDPAVLHGDFPPAGQDHFREVAFDIRKQAPRLESHTINKNQRAEDPVEVRMAQRKLTVQLDDELIRRAKILADKRGIPVSRLVGDLLENLINVDARQDEGKRLLADVRSRNDMSKRGQ